MELTLKIFAIVQIITGGLAIVGSATETALSGAIYALIGGGMFLTAGVIALVYIGQVNKERNQAWAEKHQQSAK